MPGDEVGLQLTAVTTDTLVGGGGGAPQRFSVLNSGVREKNKISLYM